MNGRFNADGLVFSDYYAETMENEVLPFLKAREKVSSLTEGNGSKPLYCVSFQADAPRGTVLVLHGFTENAYKFAEVIYSLLQNGFSVVAYDQQGHGRSWRDESVKSDLSLAHVSRFDEYVKDLERVYDEVFSVMPKPWLVFCHSMGGAVTGLFLEQRPDAFSRAAFCSPMISPSTGGVPHSVTGFLCGANRLLGRGKKRVFVSKPYAGKEEFETSCATGRERFDWYEDVKAANPVFQTNGPTYGWTLEALGVTKKLLAPGAPEKIACPVRLYTAEMEYSVVPAAQKLFIGRVKNGQQVFVKGAKHEIYRSPDDVLFPWWHDVLEFLKGNMQ